MGFMKPSTPSASAPEQTIPVKAESVEQEVGEDYQARERQRQGMLSYILARSLSSAGQGEVNQRPLLRKTLG